MHQSVNTSIQIALVIPSITVTFTHTYLKVNEMEYEEVDACFSSAPLIPGMNQIRSNRISVAVPVQLSLVFKERIDVSIFFDLVELRMCFERRMD